MRPVGALLALFIIIGAGFAQADDWTGDGLVSRAERKSEISEKDRKIGDLLKENELEAILLTKTRNQAWALGGADVKIVRAETESPVWLLAMTGGRKYLISNNIEARRLMDEESLGDCRVEAKTFPWFYGVSSSGDYRLRMLQDLIGGGQVGSDSGVAGTVDVSAALAEKRFPLTDSEIKKYRWLGENTALAVLAVCDSLKPGMSENEIAAMTAARLSERMINPTVVLIGADERLERYRHLTPTARKLRKYVLVNVCAERWGLVVAMSRLVHFGPVPETIEKNMRACARVDAVYMDNSRPGASFKEIFAKASEAYAHAGFPEEWRRHHQGGAIGYFEREFLAAPESGEVVVEGMTLAWNPTLPGVKCEDTILVTKEGTEVLTPTPGWPMIDVSLNSLIYKRPGILVRPMP